jgi:hypothetical protein
MFAAGAPPPPRLACQGQAIDRPGGGHRAGRRPFRPRLMARYS